MPIINMVYKKKRLKPWIYHNPNLWLISLSSDGSNWITIADKNLWATNVWNSGDTLSQANCWYYYQRWNNYWFPRTWSVTTSSTKVDASTYWPWNYYSSSTFITSWWWDSSQNSNLWGNTTWTLEAAQWPCSTWFHITFDIDEFRSLYNIWYSLWAWDTLTPEQMMDLLKLPKAWRRTANGNVSSQGTSGNYYMTTCSGNSWYSFSFSSTISTNNSSNYKSFWMSIRPFANTPVVPDDSRTKLY